MAERAGLVVLDSDGLGAMKRLTALLDTFRRCPARDAEGRRCKRVRNHDGMWHISKDDHHWTGAP